MRPKHAEPTAVRFTRKQRIEHVSIMSLFLLLSITGFPQKFYEAGWSAFVVDLFGGLDRVRAVHRFCGIAFALLTFVHLSTAALAVALGRARMTILPNRKDYSDAMLQIRYYLGISEQQAKFDRFDYRQKFEYWGLVLGGLVMIATGVVLYWPALVTRFLPGELVPAAKVAHSNEGLMAFLVVITWHIFNAHLAPEVFPFDKSIFTGKIELERLKHEHPLEYAHLVETGTIVPPAETPPPIADA